jgi:hypothetical protein
MKIPILISLSVFLISINAFSTTTSVTQFFLGKVQRSSMDQRPFGPAFESLVRRTTNGTTVKECVFQEGKAFISEMAVTNSFLVFSVSDLGNFTSGNLMYEDENLSAWSYDINVLKPSSGKITGSLSNGHGGRIFPDGTMKIIKIWNNQVMITENYSSIEESEYLKRLPSVVPKEMAEVVISHCL